MVSFALTVLVLAAGRLTLPKEPEKQLDALYKKITHSAAGMQVRGSRRPHRARACGDEMAA